MTNTFDPYQEAFTSKGNKNLKANDDINQKYDHEAIDELVWEEKRNRMKAMEWDLPERNVQVFSNTFVGSKLKERLSELEEINAKEEEDYEVGLVEKGFWKIIKENMQNEKFRSKR